MILYSAFRVLVEKYKGKRRLGSPGLDGRIILRWIVRKWEWIASSCMCECSIESSSYIKYEEYFRIHYSSRFEICSDALSALVYLGMKLILIVNLS
jgi:hypothetical protein